MTNIALSEIQCDPAAQPRAEINMELVSEYSVSMAEGVVFPPIVVFSDATGNWLADGWHRYLAAKGLGSVDIACDVQSGGRRDAILFACGVNYAHGQRRTNEDKRRAVMTMLSDSEWSHWADREIARRCMVHHDMVGRLRHALSVNSQIAPGSRLIERSGSVYEMDISAIGGGPRMGVVRAMPSTDVKIDRDDPTTLKQLKMITRQIFNLPLPEEAAREMAGIGVGVFDADDAHQASRWLLSYAEAYETLIKRGKRHGTA